MEGPQRCETEMLFAKVVCYSERALIFVGARSVYAYMRAALKIKKKQRSGSDALLIMFMTVHKRQRRFVCAVPAIIFISLSADGRSMCFAPVITYTMNGSEIQILSCNNSLFLRTFSCSEIFNGLTSNLFSLGDCLKLSKHAECTIFVPCFSFEQICRASNCVFCSCRYFNLFKNFFSWLIAAALLLDSSPKNLCLRF